MEKGYDLTRKTEILSEIKEYLQQFFILFRGNPALKDRVFQNRRFGPKFGPGLQSQALRPGCSLDYWNSIQYNGNTHESSVKFEE